MSHASCFLSCQDTTEERKEEKKNDYGAGWGANDDQTSRPSPLDAAGLFMAPKGKKFFALGRGSLIIRWWGRPYLLDGDGDVGGGGGGDSSGDRD